jgi:hypothetical protein
MRDSDPTPLGGVFELDMIAFVADLKPAIGPESFYDLPAIHKNRIHINTHLHKDKATYKSHNFSKKVRAVCVGDPDVVNLAGCCVSGRDI